MGREMSFEEFAKELIRLQQETVSNIEKAVNMIAEDLASASMKLAPLDEGGLMENISIEPARRNGNEVVARVGYNKEYALIRHEGFYNLGPTSRSKSGFDGMTVGRKFLQQPVDQYGGTKYMQFILDSMIAGGK